AYSDAPLLLVRLRPSRHPFLPPRCLLSLGCVRWPGCIWLPGWPGWLPGWAPLRQWGPLRPLMYPGRRPAALRPGSVEKYLARGERIVLVLRRHTVVLEPAVGLWLLILCGGVGAGLLSGKLPGWHLGAIGGWLVLVGAGFLAWKTWAWWISRYVITDQRVLLIEGVLNRRVRAIPLSKVTHTDFKRTLSGRILGYGNLSLDSPGAAAGLRELTSIPKPDEIYRLVMSLVAGVNEEGPGVLRPAMASLDDEDTGPLPRVIF
ncbi:MAG: PH domain-containing protein, partial [Actinomycetota bacterium]